MHGPKHSATVIYPDSFSSRSTVDIQYLPGTQFPDQQNTHYQICGNWMSSAGFQWAQENRVLAFQPLPGRSRSRYHQNHCHPSIVFVSHACRRFPRDSVPPQYERHIGLLPLVQPEIWPTFELSSNAENENRKKKKKWLPIGRAKSRWMKMKMKNTSIEQYYPMEFANSVLKSVYKNRYYLEMASIFLSLSPCTYSTMQTNNIHVK